MTYRRSLALFGSADGVVGKQGAPPSAITFEPLVHPSEDGVLPFEALFVISDNVVLAVDLHERHGSSQNAQRREKLQALGGRYVGIHRAVNEQQGRMNLVGVEQG